MSYYNPDIPDAIMEILLELVAFYVGIALVIVLYDMWRRGVCKLGWLRVLALAFTFIIFFAGAVMRMICPGTEIYQLLGRSCVLMLATVVLIDRFRI